MFRAGITQLFFRHAFSWLRSSLQVLHQLWLEVTGAVFFGLAVFGVPSVLKEWRAYQSGGSLWKPAAAVLFVFMMGCFGVYSFLKARRLR